MFLTLHPHHSIQTALMDRQEGPMVQLKGAKFGYEETIG